MQKKNRPNKLFLEASIGDFDNFRNLGINYVYKRSRNVDSIFFNPIRFLRELCAIAEKQKARISPFIDSLKDIPVPRI